MTTAGAVTLATLFYAAIRWCRFRLAERIGTCWESKMEARVTTTYRPILLFLLQLCDYCLLEIPLSTPCAEVLKIN